MMDMGDSLTTINCSGCGKMHKLSAMTTCNNDDCFSAYCGDCKDKNLNVAGFCNDCEDDDVFDYTADPCSVRARRG